MHKHIALEFSKVLRSGTYKQGQGYLCQVVVVTDTDNEIREERHCCLGVLTEMAIKAGVPIEKEKHQALPVEGIYMFLDVLHVEGIYEFLDESGCGWNNTLPTLVQEWAGMKNSNGGGCYNNENNALWRDNDNSLCTFEQIADIVDTHWQEL